MEAARATTAEERAATGAQTGGERTEAEGVVAEAGAAGAEAE